MGIGVVGTRVGSGVAGDRVGGGRVGLPTGAVRICMEGIVGMCLEIIRIPTGRVGIGASGVFIGIGRVGKGIPGEDSARSVYFARPLRSSPS